MESEMENEVKADESQNVITIIKYSSYTEAQRNANEKYRKNNKERINGLNRKYYNANKLKGPEFLEKKREKAKEYYQKKKLAKQAADSVCVL
jgi:hypothetical protein